MSKKRLEFCLICNNRIEIDRSNKTKIYCNKHHNAANYFSYKIRNIRKYSQNPRAQLWDWYYKYDKVKNRSAYRYHILNIPRKPTPKKQSISICTNI